MAHNLNNFKNHLHAFHESWNELSQKNSLLNNKQFLLKMAHEIELIHEDIMGNNMSSDIKENAELVDYIIASPWGAPFVFDKPLLEAARSYTQSGSEDLHHLIHEFLNYKEEINEQLFDCIEEIEEKLKKDNE